jgi:hypothetical protein
VLVFTGVITVRKTLEQYVEDANVLDVSDLEPDELEEINDLSLESFYGQIEEIDNLYRSLESIESLVSLQGLILAKEKVSTEDLAIFKEAANLALAGSDVDTRLVFPSLESNSDPRLAIEGINDKIAEGVNNIGKRIMYFIHGLNDTSVQFYSILDFQRNRAKDIRVKLDLIKKQAGNKKATITIPSSNFTSYDKPTKIIKDEKEYLNELNKSADFINGYMSNMGKMISSNFLVSLKTLFSPITGYSDQYQKIYVRMRDMIVAIAKLPGMKKTSEKDRHISQSDFLLGSYQVTCSYPKEEEFDYANAPKLKSIAKLFSLAIDHDKYLDKTTKNINNIELEVDIKYVEELLAIAEKLIKNYNDYNSVLKKLAILEASAVQSNISQVLIVPSILGYVFANFRIMLKISKIISRNTGSAFMIAKGHTKKSLAIAEKALAALEH